MNPDRDCGLCEQVYSGFIREHLPKVLALLPKKEECDFSYGYPSWPNSFDVEKFIVAVEHIADGCPACTLAFLRQSGAISREGPGMFYDYSKNAEAYLKDKHQEMGCL
jgi:hypothetical protein